MKNLLIISILLLFTTEVTLAHKGRTDASGCHNNRKSGGYHCHNSGSSYYNYEAPKKYDRLIVLDIQKALNKLQYDAGPEDGIFGSKTKRAIQQFQKNNGIQISGKPTANVLNRIRIKEATDSQLVY